jgi:hypothetical protein
MFGITFFAELPICTTEGALCCSLTHGKRPFEQPSLLASVTWELPWWSFAKQSGKTVRLAGSN